MSDYSDQRLPFAGRLKRTACTLAAVLSLSLGAGSSALAQDATPASTPAPSCDAPALPPGSPTAANATAANATPAAAPDGMNMSTPEAATPAPAEAAAGTPADAATGDEIAAAATNVANCANAGDYKGFVALLTPNLLQTLLGVTNPYDAVAGLEQQGQSFANFKTSNPVTYADGSAGIDTNYQQSKYQVVSEHWNLVKDGDYWKIDAVTTLTPVTDLNTAVVGVDLAGAKDAKTGKMVYTLIPASDSHVISPALDFHARNLGEGAEDHQLVILQLPAGADPKGLFDGTIKNSDINFIGAVTVPAGTEADLLVEGLLAGEYTLACFFNGPDGVPHAAEGMIAKFTVTPAS